MDNTSCRNARGFTLLEVLVALAILAIALGAVIKGGAENASNAAYLRDKTFAHWVAMNKIAEIRIAGAWPTTGSSNGRVEMADRDWMWRVRVSDTFDRDVRRLDVTVSAGEAEDVPLAELVAFLGRPMQAPSASPAPGSGGGGGGAEEE